MSESTSKEPVSLDSFLRLVTIDVKRKVRMTIRLIDEDGDEVPITETIEQISQFIMDKLNSSEENTISTQIFPMMAQSVAYGLTKILGPQLTSLFLTQEAVRYSLIHMMSVGFYLWNVIHKNGLKIETTEESVTQEEIDSFRRLNVASGVASMAAATGINPKDILRELVKNGYVTREDLLRVGEADILEEEDTGNKDNLN
jgi:IMP dehydrogenase/GMP reductase